MNERNPGCEPATRSSERYWNRRFAGRRAARLVVAIATAAVALFVVVPFLSLASETRGDAAGHLALARYLRDHLWPGMRGFDSQFFLGFMQGQFYPPLFHYVVATVGKFVSIEMAYRWVIALSLLVTPLCAARCARSFGLHPTRAAWFVVATLAILATSPSMGGADRLPGGTFHSTVVIGLAANGFALPLYFLAAGAIAIAFRRPSIVRSLAAAALGAIVVVSHFVCGVAIALFAGVLTLVFLWVAQQAHRGRLLRTAITIGIVAFLLSAFFVVPFLVDRSLSPLANIPAGHVPLTYALAALSTSALLLRRTRRNRGALVSALFVLVVVIAQWIGTEWGVAAHLDRFHPFVQFAALAVLAAGIPRGIALGSSGAVAGALACALTVAHRPDLTQWREPIGYQAPQLAPTERTLIVGDTLNLPGPHWISNAWPGRTGSGSALGLFVESSPVAPYLFQLAKCLVPAAPSWGVEFGSDFEDFQRELLAQSSETISARLSAALQRCGIDYVLTEQPLPPGLTEDRADDPARAIGPALREGEFRLTRVARHGSKTVQRATVVRGPLRAVPDPRSDEYLTLARAWLFGNDAAVPLPVVTSRLPVVTPSALEPAPSVAVEVLDEHAPHWRVRIDSPEPVPVVLALGFHPRVEATQVGRDLPLLRAGPGLCLVVAEGEIVVTLRRRALERICDGVSLAMWAIVGALLLAGVSAKDLQVRFRELPKGRARPSE